MDDSSAPAAALLEQIAQLSETAQYDQSSVHTAWVLGCCSLVFLMQLGFAYVEASSVRAVNVLSIAFKNLGDTCIGGLCWWATGYAIAFGQSGSPLVGGNRFFLSSDGPFDSNDLPRFALALVYGGTAATIVSGALAERVSLGGYYAIIVVIVGLTYPVLVRLFWSSEGWLSPHSADHLGSCGALDFAGSGVIHLFGGAMAAVAACWVGPRKLDGADVFSETGQQRTQPNDVFTHAVGTMFLWFSWFPFNAAGVTNFADLGHAVCGNTVVVTLLTGASAVLMATAIQWDREGKLSITHVCNSALTGLVASAGPCAYMAPAFAPLLGVVAAVLYTFARDLRMLLRIDDVVDASCVHLTGGAWGLLAVGLFADDGRVRAATGLESGCAGLLTSGSASLLGVQAVALAVAAGWGAASISLVCWFLRRNDRLRVSSEEEMAGCDEALCGGLAFAISKQMLDAAEALRGELGRGVDFPADLEHLTMREMETLLTQVDEYVSSVRKRRRVVTNVLEKRRKKREERERPPPGSLPESVHTEALAGVSVDGALVRMYSQHGMPISEHSPRPDKRHARWLSRGESEEAGASLEDARSDRGSRSGLSPLPTGSSVIGRFSGLSATGDGHGSAALKKKKKAASKVLKASARRDCDEHGDLWEPEHHGGLFEAHVPPPTPPSPPIEIPSPPTGSLHSTVEHFMSYQTGAGRHTSRPTMYSHRLLFSPRAALRQWKTAACVALLLGTTAASAAGDRFFVLAAEDVPPLQVAPECSLCIGNATVTLEKLQRGVLTMSADLDALWILFCGTLVFLMQLGFAFIEAGGVRAMNVQSIVFKNLGDCCIGALCWWAVGYGIAYGADQRGLFGSGKFFLSSDGPLPATEFPRFFLSYTYATTAVTIISGAVAERITLAGYYVLVVVVMGFSYPVLVHWVWHKDGWLSASNPSRFGSANGLLDFAGSAVIHLSGGMGALTAAIIIGPRKLVGDESVFSKAGQDMTAPHNKFSSAIGTLLLWFSWFGFNGGSVAAFSNGGHEVAATAMVTTLMSGAASCVTSLLVFPRVYGHYNLGHTCNAVLTGLVAVTAACGFVSPASSVPIGAVAALVYLAWSECRRALRIDDVLDATSVHLAGGLWGTICVGLFADGDRIRSATGDPTLGVSAGLFRGGGSAQLWTQLAGAAAVSAWAVFTVGVTCALLKVIPCVGLRVPLEEELEGIDKHLCGGLTYDYMTQLESQIEMAERAAESIALMKLDELEYLFDEERPSRLNLAFQNIVKNLREFAAYLPESILNQDIDTDGESAQSSISDIDGERVESKDGTSDGNATTPRKGVRRMQKGLGFGVVFHNKTIVMYASLHRPRGAWPETVRQEQAVLQECINTGRLDKCEVCWHPKLTTEFCAPTGKRHEQPPGSVTGLLTAWLETLIQTQNEHNAMLENLIGSDAVLSFDTTKKAAARHVCMAAVELRNAGVKLQQRSEEAGASAALTVAIGAASGGMCVGNIGSDRARRRIVLGAALQDSRCLSMMCQLFGVSAIVEARVAKDAIAHGFAGLREIGNVQLPETSRAGVVFHIDAQAPSPLPLDVRGFSGAWDALMSGDIDDAMVRLAAYLKLHPTDKVAEGLHLRVQTFRSGQWKSGRQKRTFATVLQLLKESPVTDSSAQPQHTSSPTRLGRAAPGGMGDHRMSAMSARSGSESVSLQVQRPPLVRAESGFRKVCFTVAQLSYENSGGLLSEEQGLMLPDVKYMHGEALQVFASLVRSHGGSVVWAADDKIIARWLIDSERNLVNVAHCIGGLVKTAPFGGESNGRRAAIGVSVGSACMTRCGGDTDETTVFLGDVAAKAEVLACAALGERMLVLAEGISFVDTHGFCWEPVTFSGLFQRPPGRVLRAGQICRMQVKSSISKEYQKAMQHIFLGEWSAAREVLQSCFDRAEDPWVARLQAAVLEADLSDAEEIRVRVTPTGMSIEATRAIDGVHETADHMRSTADVLKEAVQRKDREDEIPQIKTVSESESKSGMIWFGSNQRSKAGRAPVRRAPEHVSVPIRRAVQDILFPGDGARVDSLAKALVQRDLELKDKRRQRIDVQQISVVLSTVLHVPVLLGALWNCVVIPTRMGFPRAEGWTDEAVFQTAISSLADFVFITHITTLFVKPYYDQGQLVTQPHLTAEHYFRGEFAADLVSSLPWELLWAAAQGSSILYKYPWVRVNRLLRALRLHRLIETCAEAVVTDCSVRFPVQLRLCIFIVHIFLVLLWLGCLWGGVSDLGGRGLNGYLGIDGFDLEPMWYQAIMAVFVAMRGCSLGLWQRYPENDAETLAMLIMSIAGLFLFACFLGYVQTLLELMRSSENVRDAKFDDLCDFKADLMAKTSGHSREVKLVFDYHRHLWDKMRQAYAGQFAFLTEELPPSLGAELLYFMNCKVMDRVSSLCPATPDAALFAVRCVSKLELSFQPPGQTLLRQGHRDDGVFFIYSGSAVAEIGQRGQRLLLEEITDGGCWGEIAAIWGGVQKADFTITEYSEVFALSCQDFRALAHEFPDCMADFCRSGERRKQEIVARRDPGLETDDESEGSPLESQRLDVTGRRLTVTSSDRGTGDSIAVQRLPSIQGSFVNRPLQPPNPLAQAPAREGSDLLLPGQSCSVLPLLRGRVNSDTGSRCSEY